MRAGAEELPQDARGIAALAIERLSYVGPSHSHAGATHSAMMARDRGESLGDGPETVEAMMEIISLLDQRSVYSPLS